MTITHEKQIPLLSQSPLPLKAASFRKSLLSWYGKVKRPLPWRLLWEAHGNPYHVWLSEVMLQQTLISAVIPTYERFLARFPSIYELAAASEDEVKQSVAGLGYYRRFRFLHQSAKLLTKQFPAPNTLTWPNTFAAWKALPGIGDYTAAAISSIAFGQAEAVVDGNVERVLSRLLDVRLPPNLPALKKQFKLLSQALIDPVQAGDFNQAMMELGQTLCTVQNPRCQSCPLRAHCLAYQRQSTSLAPQAKLKKESIETFLRLTIVKHAGRYALIERPLGAKFLKETSGFVTELGEAKKAAKAYCIDGFPSLATQNTISLGSFRHSITKHRIVAEVCLGSACSLNQDLPRKWYRAEELEQRLIANLDRKAWKLYQASLA